MFDFLILDYFQTSESNFSFKASRKFSRLLLKFYLLNKKKDVNISIRFLNGVIFIFKKSSPIVPVKNSILKANLMKIFSHLCTLKRRFRKYKKFLFIYPFFFL